MAKIAFAISDEFPNLTDDDRLAANAMEALGAQVDAVLWDADVDWTAYDAVVIRSLWDYHQRFDEFGAWLGKLERDGANLHNPAEVVRWNMDKQYLSELQDDGVAVLPSVWLPGGARPQLAELLSEKGWTQVVVKPVISAGARNTFVVQAEQAAEMQAQFIELLAHGGVIVQPFAPEIQTQGEWSFIFFNGKFSHAVIKRPKDGDFRVQMQYGGVTTAEKAPADLLAQAGRVLEAIEGDLLYARVDAIEREGQLLLMELELIEPFLFFGNDPQAAGRFAEAVIASLKARR